MTKKNKKLIPVISILMLTIFLGIYSVSALASSYVPKIDGKYVLYLNPGESKDYYIYPQNYDQTNEKYFKLYFISGNNLIQNPSQLDSYFIAPPQTLSDDLPIKVIIKMPITANPGEETLFEWSGLMQSSTDFPAQNPSTVSKKIYVTVTEEIPNDYEPPQDEESEEDSQGDTEDNLGDDVQEQEENTDFNILWIIVGIVGLFGLYKLMVKKD